MSALFVMRYDGQSTVNGERMTALCVSLKVGLTIMIANLYFLCYTAGREYER